MGGMKQIIHPANVSEGDIVEFCSNDIAADGTRISVGSKAKFVCWCNCGNMEFAEAVVLSDGFDKIVITSPDVLVVEV